LDSADFVFIFAFQGGVIRQLSRLFVSLALHLVELALFLMVGGCFHDVLLGHESVFLPENLASGPSETKVSGQHWSFLLRNAHNTQLLVKSRTGAYASVRAPPFLEWAFL